MDATNKTSSIIKDPTPKINIMESIESMVVSGEGAPLNTNAPFRSTAANVADPLLENVLKRLRKVEEMFAVIQAALNGVASLATTSCPGEEGMTNFKRDSKHGLESKLGIATKTEAEHSIKVSLDVPGVECFTSSADASGGGAKKPRESVLNIVKQKEASQNWLCIVEHLKQNGALHKWELTITDPDVLDLIYKSAEHYIHHTSRSQWEAEKVTLNSDFLPLIFHWEILEEASKKETSNSKDVKARKRLKTLLEHVQAMVPDVVNARKSRKDIKSITWKYLWTVFKPGDLVVSSCFLDTPQIFQVHDLRTEDDDKEKEFRLSAWCYDWNGSQLVRRIHEFGIPVYENERNLKELLVYPLELHDDAGGNPAKQSLKTTMLKNGERFRELCSTKAKQFFCDGDVYEDLVSSDDERYLLDLFRRRKDDIMRKSSRIRENVMVDAKSYLLYGSPRLWLGNSAPSQNRPCECSMCLPVGRKEWIRDFPKSPKSISDGENLLLLPPRALGYALNRKAWVQMATKNLKTLSPDATAYEKELVFPSQLGAQQKKDLKTLVRYHKSGRSVRDSIEDKGEGLIILLHGPTGTGKTLTAETLAKASEKPLFKAGISDVGLDPANAERKLRKLFDLAEAWNAILLLDEADVLLDSRGKVNEGQHEKNALVAILLREVEYFKGVLIMTTNRVRTFDTAMLSRIHCALNFRALNSEQEISIWNIWTNKLIKEEACDDLQALKKWYKDHAEDNTRQWRLNGREIRNLITTAQGLAEATPSGQVTLEFIKRRHTSIMAFKKETFEVQAASEYNQIVGHR